ncbi:MAG: membrane protein insertion efficiency factor YidD [Clostridia bacterium]|nr:membrane protein insertion efficiency factor YidD [Clostridia bacterium]
MHKAFKILLSPLLFVEILLLKFYKSFISPNTKATCCFLPTCSSYMLKSLLKFDAITGLFIGCKRLMKCNGKNFGGVDLEPLNILGDFKWVC